MGQKNARCQYIWRARAPLDHSWDQFNLVNYLQIFNFFILINGKGKKKNAFQDEGHKGDIKVNRELLENIVNILKFILNNYIYSFLVYMVVIKIL